MGSMSRKQGQSVALEYSATPATQAIAIPIQDSDDNVLTLQPYQRLVVDSVAFNTDAAADTADLAYLIEAATAPAAIPTVGVLASFSIAPNLGSQGMGWPGEGHTCAQGNTLWLYVPATTLESSNVTLTGAARIIQTSTVQGRQPYQAQLTPGTTAGRPF